jgi:hypothetical protein
MASNFYPHQNHMQAKPTVFCVRNHEPSAFLTVVIECKSAQTEGKYFPPF